MGTTGQTTGDATGDRGAGSSGPPRWPAWLPWVVATLALGVVAVVVAVVRYDALPDPYPTHFGLDGTPDAYAPLGRTRVLWPLVVGQLSGLAVIATSGLARTPRARAAFTTPICALGTALGGGTALISAAQHLSADAAPPPWTLWAFLLVVLAALAWLTWASTRQARAALSEQHDSAWRGGLIYADRDNPAIFVPNPSGLGTTINLGRPLGWAVLAALLLPAVAIVLVAVVVL